MCMGRMDILLWIGADRLPQGRMDMLSYSRMKNNLEDKKSEA